MPQLTTANPNRMPTAGGSRRRLIVNADDLGMTAGVNRAIFAAHQQGIVTSASLLVRRAAARPAAELAARHPALSLGLHVDLGEWAYENNEWNCLYEVVVLDDAAQVAREVEQQLDEFLRLTGRSPTHLDSHQHVHLHEPAKSVLIKLSERLSVPLRHFTKHVRYSGDFYGQTGKGQPCRELITVEALVEIVSKLPLGVTELACHPGLPGSSGTGEGMYVAERGIEFATLCDRRIRDSLSRHGVETCSFADLSDAMRVAGGGQ